MKARTSEGAATLSSADLFDDLDDPNPPSRWVRGLVRPVGGRPALLVELFIFWMFLQYFNLAQERIRGGRVESIHNARNLLHLEQFLHIDVERFFNMHLAHVPWLAQGAGWYYGMVLVTVPATLAWCWWANPQGFRHIRRTLIATTLPSLLVFWLLPMAPPRFAVPGIVDINFVYDILGGRLARDPSRSANLYAAMPSLHCAWSTWAGYSLFVTYRRRRPLWGRIAWAIPAVTAWDVMATGNHFVMDVVAGAGLFLMALFWVRVVGYLERRVWDEQGLAEPRSLTWEPADARSPSD